MTWEYMVHDSDNGIASKIIFSTFMQLKETLKHHSHYKILKLLSMHFTKKVCLNSKFKWVNVKWNKVSSCFDLVRKR